MINLRYHVVSITAVFLALGLGLTLGSTFLDRATVDSLNNQLSSLDGDLANRNSRISDLEKQLGSIEEERDAFSEQGLAPLVDGELTDVPVVVFVSKGTDERITERTLASLSAAGASVAGTWTITERFALDDDAERRDLASVLGISTDLETRLRREVAQQMASLLADRMAPVALPDADDSTSESDVPGGSDAPSTDEHPTEGGTTDPTAAPDTVLSPDGESTPTSEPSQEDLTDTTSDLLDGLVSAGFLSFQPIGDGGPEAVLPTADARVVILADAGSKVAPDRLVMPLIENLTADGPASIVLGSGVPAEADSDTRGSVVDLVRDDEELAGLVTTVDDLESLEGWLALVLAVEASTNGQVAHYGKAPSASQLLPAVDGSE